MRSLFQNVQNNVMALVERVEQLEKQVATIEQSDLEGQPLTDNLMDRFETLEKSWTGYESTVLVLDQRLSALESCGGSSASTAERCSDDTRSYRAVVAVGTLDVARQQAPAPDYCSGYMFTLDTMLPYSPCGCEEVKDLTTRLLGEESISRGYLQRALKAEQERDAAVAALEAIESLLAKHWSDEA
jgi:hypothetical protein